MKKAIFTLLMFSPLVAAAPAFANVLVTSPQMGQTVPAQVVFAATGNTNTCSQGVAAMGVYIDDQLSYVVNGTTVKTSLSLPAGKHSAAIQEWDYCGGSTKTVVPITVSNGAGVWVMSPAKNSTVSSLTNYVANATSNCPAGVAAMGVYVNDRLMHVSQGSKLDAQLNLSVGKQRTVVQSWDNCGGSSTSPVDVNVVGPGTTLSNLQMASNWKSSGQVAPLYDDCTDHPMGACSGVSWSMAQGVSSPSLSGKAAMFQVGGTTPYSDALFYNQLIGSFSTQGLPDVARTILPSLHNFTYDADFFVPDTVNTQALEFDINWFMDSIGMTWGTQCRVRGGNEWDLWDNVQAKWIPTGISCNPLQGAWNHVTVSVQRAPDNTLIYQSITLNGVTSHINKTYQPFTVPQDWYGVTVNFQIDGDDKQTPIKAYVDNLNLMYW